MFIPPPIPLLDPLLEDFEMFRVRHGRVTSLASAMRMILTVSSKATLYATLPAQSMHKRRGALNQNRLSVRSRIRVVSRKAEPVRAELKLAQDGA